MKLLKTALTVCFFLTFIAFSYAQSASLGLLASNDMSPKGIVEEEWSFYYDADEKVYYIDFETISFNLTKVKVVSLTGETIISDDVEDLPVNTIYEIDCSKFNGGKYTVELHAYTEILKKEVTIK